MRTVLFANVGKLPGGLMLVPDASAEDGWMDVATLDARAGIVGWTELFGNVMAQGAGVRIPDVLKAYGTSRIDHARGKTIVVTYGSHVQGAGGRGGPGARAQASRPPWITGAIVVRRAHRSPRASR